MILRQYTLVRLSFLNTALCFYPLRSRTHNFDKKSFGALTSTRLESTQSNLSYYSDVVSAAKVWTTDIMHPPKTIQLNILSDLFNA